MVSQAALDQGERRRQDILAFIRSFLAENGYSPSISEIGEAVGVSSPNSVRSHLARMKEEGLIDMTPRIARSIRIL